MITIPGILTAEERHAQMAVAVKQGFPFLRRQQEFHDGLLSIVCYGPSLLETWREINQKDYLPILTVSGAHDFLSERGITPDYHVHMDPRAFEPEMLANPNDQTKYLMASCCAPEFWAILKKRHVELWHLINGPETIDWVRVHHSRGLKSCIGGGSTVGQRAMNVGASLGYRRFRIYGMDLSFGPQHWAGPHPGNDEPIIQVDLNGKTYKTTPQLLKAAQEMEDFLKSMDVEIEFHGNGLMQEVAKMTKKENRNVGG